MYSGYALPLPKQRTLKSVYMAAACQLPLPQNHTYSIQLDTISVQVQMDMVNSPPSIKTGALLICVLAATLYSLFRRVVRPKETPVKKPFSISDNGYLDPTKDGFHE